MMGIDADYGMSRAFDAQGWPTFVVIDAEGIVRFHGFDPDRQLAALRRCLRELPPAAVPGPKPALERGIAYPADALASRRARREHSPRLAFDRSGNAHVVFWSNRDGTNAVYLRRFNPKGDQVLEERLSPGDLECYAPDCAVDSQDTLWVAWSARRTGFYDIYVHARRAGQAPVTQQLSFSDDDAMSPKIATGPDGTVAVTYYKWAMLWGYSRDRNIFERTYDPSRRAWSNELEISPHVPEVEDHSDPDVVLDRQGNVWVAWSYDYHPTLYKKPLDAAQPTIFAARARSNAVSAPVLVGATGRFRDAIDLFPSAAVDGQGTLWCAWDCSEPRRCIRLARHNPAADTFTLVNTFGEPGQVCSTPELSPAAASLLLAWSQRGAGGHWQGKVALLKDGQVSADATLTESAAVFFPQAQQAPDGQYWVTYEKASPQGSEVVLRNITPLLKRSE